MSITSRRELVFLLLQYLDDEEYKETVHKLERESGFFFNMKYFEECVTNGDWDEVESYLSGFSKFDGNRHSMKIFFEIRKQRYLEALDRHDHAKAVDILQKYLKGFSGHNEGIFKASDIGEFQWVPRESSGVITDATYSCDCQSVYATFEDGSVSIITTPTFQHRCRIYPAAYLPCSPRRVYPAAVAAHPSEPNQFAVGLSDGGVLVLKPPESAEQWGSMPPVEGGRPSTSPPGAGLD